MLPSLSPVIETALSTEFGGLRTSPSRSFALPFLAFLLASCSWAEVSQAALVKRPYTERLTADVPLSGHELVGLRSGMALGVFDPARVGAIVTPAIREHLACVRVTTNDGRYYAENLYRLPQTMGPATFDAPSKFRADLARYPADQVAIHISIASSCNSAETAAVVPSIYYGDSGEQLPLRSLAVYVNPEGSQVEATLLRDGKELHSAQCESRRAAVGVTFSVVCSIPLPPDLAPATYSLVIRVRETFDWHRSEYPLSLAPTERFIRP